MSVFPPALILASTRLAGNHAPLAAHSLARLLAAAVLPAVLLCTSCVVADRRSDGASSAKRVSIENFGAIGDGATLNTPRIQAAIDHLASRGGGTLVVPRGVFLTGAIFLKPGVNLRLNEGAVLKGSTNKSDYPKMQTRIEGHFPEWLPALINADGANGLRISGSGTLDGNGAPFWEEFWAARRRDPRVTNLAVERPRLMLIQNSRDVQISGITFKNSGFWNLHLYRCRDVVVENARFETPSEVRCPSTDGTDIDSCQDVTIRGCVYRVDDDCIALKGTKGPFALQDESSPPVENIRVLDCVFERGHGVVTLGSEATIVRNVTVENCRVVGPNNLVRLKLRPDTAQHYENLRYNNITLEGSGGAIFQVQPWRQFFDLKGQPPPNSIVRNVTVSNVKGRFGSFGTLRGNPGQTAISGITLGNIDVTLQNSRFNVGEVTGLEIQDVTVNGSQLEVSRD